LIVGASSDPVNVPVRMGVHVAVMRGFNLRDEGHGGKTRGGHVARDKDGRTFAMPAVWPGVDSLHKGDKRD